MTNKNNKANKLTTDEVIKNMATGLIWGIRGAKTDNPDQKIEVAQIADDIVAVHSALGGTLAAVVTNQTLNSDHTELVLSLENLRPISHFYKDHLSEDLGRGHLDPALIVEVWNRNPETNKDTLVGLNSGANKITKDRGFLFIDPKVLELRSEQRKVSAMAAQKLIYKIKNGLI